jgi:ligand-binding sensor domain-containing protein
MRYALLFLLFFTELAVAQDFSNSWEGHFSYNAVTNIVKGDSEVIVASQNAVYRYDLVSEQITTFSTINGLNGRNISQIYYSVNKDIIVVGFENGLLQLIMGDNSVVNIVAIQDKPSIPVNRKRINDFLERGDLLYIATDFGIALFDLNRIEFEDTYFIGENASLLEVKAIIIEGNSMYAASTSNGGIRRANLTNPFLLDFSNWTQINTGSFNNLTNFNGELFAADGPFQYRYTGVNFLFQGAQRAVIRDYYSGRDLRVTTFENELSVFNTTGNEILVVGAIAGVTYDLTTSIIVDGSLFIGTRENGMIIIDIASPAIPAFVTAPGPSRNDVFSVTSEAGDVWIGYGDHTFTYNPFPLERRGASRFKDETWDNYANSTIQGIRSIASITINKENTEQVFLHSMQDGILQFEPDGTSILYNASNATLRGVGAGNGDPNDIRSSEGIVDRQGNLWTLNLQRDQPLLRRTPSGQWSATDFSTFFPNIARTGGVGSIDILRSGQLVFGSVDFGIFGYDPAANTFANITEGVQRGGLVNNYVSALKVDQRGALWIGSNLGLRVLFGPASMFTDNIQDARSIVIEDASGIPRELLDDEAVLDIEIDGNNNKWVATANSGALLLSPSGRETLFQFTTSNSPLPDNEVRDISIDDTTGLVYFATKNGLVSFKGDRASKPQESLENVYAFPNPVRPGFMGNVVIDGLTERARVKITDIEGNLVYEKVSNGGTIQWDTRSFSGNMVASGVYLLFISTSDNIETKVTKLLIVR